VRRSRAVRRLLLLLRSNWISATGAVVTTLAFMLFVTTFVFLSLHGGGHTAYAGLVAFVVLPGVFIAGLVAIPVGLLVFRKQLKARMAELEERPIRLLRVVGVLTVANLAVAGTGGYEALHYMDSQEFCGTLCHEVMSPTYNAYVDSPHARVACVECHIGGGASWFVKSKLSGLRQVAAVLLDSYQKPIPTPVHDLRPARDTCEQCHWPSHFSGDRLVVRTHFAEDEAVTSESTVLVLKTGGVRPDGTASGIHWHVHPGNAVTYLSTDDRRMDIPWVRYVDGAGNERVFTSEDYDPENPPTGTVRTMDCVDCHNQPSHAFQDPGQALDNAIAGGRISRDLPSVRKVGMELLETMWTRDSAADGILQAMRGRYRGTDVNPDLVAQSSEALAEIWLRNIYPEMAITWGTYPSMTNHKGCMRCHDGEHFDDDGNEISMDCENCHVMLADRERDPEILEQLGLQGDR
jgi:hypothetical protein